MFIYIVREKQEVVIESLGKYVKTVATPGIKLKLPWPFQSVAARVHTDIQESKADLKTKTADDIFITIPIKMHLQTLDSKKYHYNSNNPHQQVESRVTAAVKQLVSAMDFAELYQAREKLSEQVREKVGQEIENLYGVRIVDIIVDEPVAPGEIETSYNNVRASEREATATVNKARANKEASILEAEGRKETLRLEGEGIAEQRSAIFMNYAEQFNAMASKGMPTDQVQQTILMAMVNDTQRDMAEHGNVIVTTSNANELLAQIQALAKTLNAPKPAKDGAARAQPSAAGPKSPS